MNKLKVGIAGYGIVGQRRHIYIDQHPNLEVIAVCDQNFEKEVVNEDGIYCFTDYLPL